MEPVSAPVTSGRVDVLIASDVDEICEVFEDGVDRRDGKSEDDDEDDEEAEGKDEESESGLDLRPLGRSASAPPPPAEAPVVIGQLPRADSRARSKGQGRGGKERETRLLFPHMPRIRAKNKWINKGRN